MLTLFFDWHAVCNSDLRSLMLRISANEATGEAITLRLDGQVSGRWVKLLEGTCEAQLNKGARVIIDLKNVSFADRDGAHLFRSLQDRKGNSQNPFPSIPSQTRS